MTTGFGLNIGLTLTRGCGWQPRLGCNFVFDTMNRLHLFQSSREDGRGDGCPGSPITETSSAALPATPVSSSIALPSSTSTTKAVTPPPPLPLSPCLPPAPPEPELLSPRITSSVSHLSLQSTRHNR